MVLLPVVLLVGGLLFVWGISREPELNYLPLSEHLLKLQLSDKEVRSETLKLIVDHQALFGPYCLDLVANETPCLPGGIPQICRQPDVPV